MTRGPAKPMRAPGSARIMSPSMAKLAVTPPVVGSVSTEMYKRPASLCRFTAADVLAICMREASPSCMRAPPEQANTTMGSRSRWARSKARVSFSPATVPMLPMRNRVSHTAMAHRIPPMVPTPVITASSRPLFPFRLSSFSPYAASCKGLRSRMPSSHA